MHTSELDDNVVIRIACNTRIINNVAVSTICEPRGNRGSTISVAQASQHAFDRSGEGCFRNSPSGVRGSHLDAVIALGEIINDNGLSSKIHRNAGTEYSGLNVKQVFSCTTNQVGKGAIRTRGKRVVTSTGINDGELLPHSQRVGLGGAHEFVGKVVASNSRVLECIVAIVNNEIREARSMSGSVDDDFGLTMSIGISLLEDDLIGGFAVKVIVLQRSCNDVGSGALASISSLGAELNAGGDFACAVDQPVRTGGGVGEGIGDVVRRCRTGEHGRAGASNGSHGIIQLIRGSAGDGGGGSGKQIGKASLLFDGHGHGIRRAGNGVLLSQNAGLLGGQRIGQGSIGLHAGIRIERRILGDGGIGRDVADGFAGSFKLGLAEKVIVFQGGQSGIGEASFTSVTVQSVRPSCWVSFRSFVFSEIYLVESKSPEVAMPSLEPNCW